MPGSGGEGYDAVDDFSNVGGGMQVSYQVNMEASYEDFAAHMEQCNMSYKNQIMQKVQMMSQMEINILNKKIEEMKIQEGQELTGMNREFFELDQNLKKQQRKNARVEQLNDVLIDKWRNKRLLQKVLHMWKTDGGDHGREKKMAVYCDKFKGVGRLRQVMKGFKLWSQMSGNRLYKMKCEKQATIEVEAMVKEKVNQLEFLQDMVCELEEKYRIELRKKTILKSQCDQAYLRGVSAISMEALKMSNQTVGD